MPSAFIPPDDDTIIAAVMGAKRFSIPQIVRDKLMTVALCCGFVDVMKMMSVSGLSRTNRGAKMTAGISIHQLPAKAYIAADATTHASPRSITRFTLYRSATQPMGTDAIVPTAEPMLLNNPNSTGDAPRSLE